MEAMFISAMELNDIIENERLNEDYILIDLREKEEYDRFHIYGATNYEYDYFMELDDYEKYFGNVRKIILYCDRGGRSLYALRRVQERNVNKNNRDIKERNYMSNDIYKRKYTVNNIYEKRYDVKSLEGGINTYMKNNTDKIVFSE